MTEPRLDAAGDWVCEHGTAMDVHCCNCHSGFQFNYTDCHCTSAETTGALPTDKIWELLNDADDHKTAWSEDVAHTKITQTCPICGGRRTHWEKRDPD
jgi:hypothetical protein